MYQISVTNEEIEKLELKAFEGEIVVVDKPGRACSAAIAYLKRQTMLGFDTESKPVFEAHQHSNGVALLQLSGPKKAYLFRVKKTGMPKGIVDILGNPNIIKIGAAVGDDIRRLKRDFGFEPASFADLQTMGWEYGIKDKSVKKMAAIIMGIRISKTQQLSNWEAEELSPAQQKYAATDAWVCREMYLRLLKSEKNPLTPEQLKPNPPKNSPASEAMAAAQTASASKEGEAKKKKKRRKKKKKVDGGAQAAAPKAQVKKELTPEELARQAARRNARTRRRREQRKKKKALMRNENNVQDHTEERA